MTTRAAAEPSTADLIAALEPIMGAVVTRLERRPAPNRSSHPLELLTATTDDGRRSQLVFKDLNRVGLSGDARTAKAEAHGPAWRELDVYRDVLSGIAGAAPTRRGEHRDERAGRYWLFLEPVTGAELYNVGDFDVWVAALGSLPGIHDSVARAPRPGSLGRYDEPFFRRWPARAIELAAADDRALLRRVAERYDDALERLLTLPQGVVHGDLYPSNVMIRPANAEHGRLALLDWESAGVGPPLLDVATLTAGSWTAEQRDRMTLAYLDALPASDRPGRECFLADVDCCRLHVALQWLGWSRTWSPPPEHRHDWTSDARTAAERLGLL